MCALKSITEGRNALSTLTAGATMTFRTAAIIWPLGVSDTVRYSLLPPQTRLSLYHWGPAVGLKGTQRVVKWPKIT